MSIKVGNGISARQTINHIFIIIVFSFLLAACTSLRPPTATQAPSEAVASPTAIPSPSTTPSPSATAAPSAMPATSATAVPSATAAPSITPSPSATPNSTVEVAALTTEVTLNKIYANVDDSITKLDVHAPIEGGSWPVVIVVHGAMLGKGSTDRLAKTIASQGAVVYNIDVVHPYPATISIERIGCAVRYARARAAEYGGDPSRITMIGHSFGANTGIVAALAGDSFEGACVVRDRSALVDAFIGYEGVYDIATTLYSPLGDYTILEEEDPELWQAIDPYSHIGMNPELQIRLIHGQDEDLAWYDILPDVSADYYQALVDGGYDVELNVVDGESHGDVNCFSCDAFALTISLAMELARSSE